jgi:hypothetical protein
MADDIREEPPVPPMRRCGATPEARAKMRVAALRRKPMSDETRIRIGDAMRRRAALGLQGMPRRDDDDGRADDAKAIGPRER